MAKVGRPSKLTPEVKRRFIEAIRAGSYYEPACEYAGIDYSTFRSWMQRGSNDHPTRPSSKEFVDFVEEVMLAEAEAELFCVAAIKSAAKDDWRAAGWLLERRQSARWADMQRVQVQVQQQVESEINLLFNSIAADPDIPHEAKQKLFESAARLKEKAAAANGN